ncbi:MAG: hypothetical protein LLH30_05280 [Candidatus Manganitrophus sp. SA1]|nr:hypothetical protein [Candidatus Manganitrophus morganii]
MNNIRFSLAVVLVVCLISTNASAETVDQRAAQILGLQLSNPVPNPNSTNWGERCLGRATYALAAYYTNQNISTANDYINDIQQQPEYWINGSNQHAFDYNINPGIQDFPCWDAISWLWRIYLDPTMNSRMSNTSRDALEYIMWFYVRTRSKHSDFIGSVWTVNKSENIDALQKSNYALAVQALSMAGPPYGPSLQLRDGYTIDNHYTGWVAYWKKYFRERAREGINIEVASPTYARTTLAAYYNLRDFSESSVLVRLAGDFLTLYWADVANEYLASAGVRGGAKTRNYKNVYLTRGREDGLCQWFYLYLWHHNENACGIHPYVLMPATSSYRIPDIVTAIATGQKPPYQYISRRPGFGTHDSMGNYLVQFDAGNSSHIRRYTYATQDYVLGTMTVNPAGSYTNINRQNRWMGIVMADDPDSRIVIHGLGTRFHGNSGLSDTGDGIGYSGLSEITGIAAVNCMVVGRDPSVEESLGTRIYISARGSGALWGNRIENDGGWFFTYAGGAYVGIRIASGGYVPHTVTDATGAVEGKMLDLVEWSPIIIQMGQASMYSSFDNFKTSVKANTFTYSNGKLTYDSENGDRFEFWANSNTLPKLNGATPSLNPAKTYSSPYIQGFHGEDVVTIAYPGYTSLVLNFSY